MTVDARKCIRVSKKRHYLQTLLSEARHENESIWSFSDARMVNMVISNCLFEWTPVARLFMSVEMSLPASDARLRIYYTYEIICYFRLEFE